MQFLADSRGNKLFIIKWDDSAKEFLETNGFVLQNTTDIDISVATAYGKTFRSHEELKAAINLMLNSQWNISFI